MRIIGGSAAESEQSGGRARRRAARVPLAALATVLAVTSVAACGSDSDTDAGSKPVGHKAPPVVDVTASGAKDHWTFGVPETVTGGVVTFRLTNKSTSDTHDLQIIKVDGTHTKDDIMKIISSEDSGAPEWMHGYGGVATVAPGQTGSATMDLPAGHYIYFCTDDSDGKGHADHGMYGEFDAKGSSGAAMPTSTATIKSLEYKFEMSGLKAGKNVVKFSNVGKQVHMAIAVPIQAGKTIDDVRTAFTSQDQSAEPPVDFEKMVGTEVIDPGQSLVTTWNLSTGKYAVLCFMSDRAGGPPHFMSGMLQELDVA